MPVIATPPPPPQPTLQTSPPPPQQRSAEMSIVTPKPASDNNGVQSFLQPSPSRWPKSEVQALIKLRTNLDMKYQENGPKGPLWEEISAGMRKMGYNRNAKRCKEKWENINKYFKKVKESNKKRPQDSKTCPYFHQLEALYREKGTHSSYTTSPAALPPPPPVAATAANPMLPIMARPEQQWPIVQPHPPQQQQQQHHHHHHQDSAMEEDRESDNMDENDHDEDDGDDDDDDDDEGGGYEMVTNKQASSVATSAAE